MKTFLKSLPLLFVLALGAAPPSLAATLAEVVRAVEAPFSSGRIRDYSASFAQEARIAALDRVQRAGGEVQVRLPAGQASPVMFRWHYSRPALQELVSDGRTLWVYVAENNQVIVSPVDTTTPAESNPMAFLTGLGNLSRDFTVSFATPAADDQGNHRIELVPRRPSPVLARMLLVVAREAVTAGGGGTLFPVLAATVIDPSDNSTTITFSDVRVNRGLAASHFTFTTPPGVEVVRPTAP